MFVSDNPAFDFQWINHGFWHALGYNPLGHSGRRVGDYYAGLVEQVGGWSAPDTPGREGRRACTSGRAGWSFS